ncbi:L-asparaginase [Halorientalis sp. IM1011]|uniref:asparaginase n=1 Tax=Halorientalis sp. IM1011 TaxID=1932360 RepID=UPI00097CC44F|nr:asparaginase [Halorientalis sp. IM1011]AQL43132.1 L-asparaginase [Halorientalis sp. IM1011]
MPPTVTVLGTGGTIASTAEGGGATPTLSTDALLEAVPGLAEVADVRTEQVAQIPSYELDFETAAEIRTTAADAADSSDGVVVTHGTDTMAESAYLLDLTFAADVPVVFTGAQRRPDEPSPDGPSNLLTAVRAAVHDRLADVGGVYVAFDERLHAARDVQKVHTRRLDAFASPDAGHVASFTPEGVRFVREPGSRSDPFPGTAVDPDLSVPIVSSGIGVDATALECAREAGADAVVLEGTGLGNATAPLGDAVRETVERGVPVVVTTRCRAGSTAPVYGASGGGQTLAEHGAVFAGHLPAEKARLKLLVALSAAVSVDVATLFEDE